jgi:hypothetical protein
LLRIVFFLANPGFSDRQRVLLDRLIAVQPSSFWQNKPALKTSFQITAIGAEVSKKVESFQWSLGKRRSESSRLEEEFGLPCGSCLKTKRPCLDTWRPNMVIPVVSSSWALTKLN